MSDDDTPDRRSRPGSDAVTWEVRAAAAWTWRLLLLGLGVYVVLRLFERVELVAFSFILSLFFTAVLHPLERVLRRVPGPRSISSLLAMLIGLAALVGIGYFVAWQVTEHAGQLSEQVSDAVANIRRWLKDGPLHLKSSDLDKLSTNITNSIKKNQGKLVTGVVDTVRSVVEGLGALLLVILSTFFLLRDGEAIWRWTLRFFPRAAHERVDRAGHVGWGTLGGYMRGQVTIALFHGVTIMVLLFILRVPLAAALGALIFLGAFIPLIGLVIAGAFAVAVTLLEHGLTSAIIVAVAIVILVQLESHLLQPLIMSRTVRVHPLAVALAVLTGTLLAGIVGALLAVPLVAFLNSTINALRARPALPEDGSSFPVQHETSVKGDPVDPVAEDDSTS